MLVPPIWSIENALPDFKFFLVNGLKISKPFEFSHQFNLLGSFATSLGIFCAFAPQQPFGELRKYNQYKIHKQHFINKNMVEALLALALNHFVFTNKIISFIKTKNMNVDTRRRC
jgi:hypothetical protein